MNLKKLYNEYKNEQNNTSSKFTTQASRDNISKILKKTRKCIKLDSIEKALELYEVCPELDYIMLNSEDLESHPLFIWNVTHGITYQQLSTDILKNRYNYLFEWDVLDFENIFEDHVEMFI